jgi:hypothetical protein
MTYLKAWGRIPCTICANWGTEFVNKALKNWCHSQGIALQVTAPYSPLQNGVAEQMNHTLVKLAHAMLMAAQLLEFLWEPTIGHVAYLRNLSYTKPRAKVTPYQIWHRRKPSVLHLREFSAPIWVLLQGQRIQRKMLPKSLRRAYLGFDEGSKSIKYYNTMMRTILTLQNFCFLSLVEPSPLEELAIDLNAPLQGECDPPCKGEREDGTRRAAPRNGPEDSRKRKVETNIDPREPQKTRGICRNYRHLNNGHHPFPDKEEAGMILIAKEKAFTMIPEDDCCSLKEAHESHDWCYDPVWDC